MYEANKNNAYIPGIYMEDKMLLWKKTLLSTAGSLTIITLFFHLYRKVSAERYATLVPHNIQDRIRASSWENLSSEFPTR